MKQILLALLLIGFIGQANAQMTVLGSCPESLWTAPGGTLEGHNKIINTTSTAAHLKWTLSASTCPGDWGSAIAFCDIEFCRPPGISTGETSFDFMPGDTGFFKPQFTAPSYGCCTIDVTAWLVGDSAASAVSCSWAVCATGVEDVDISNLVKTYPNPARSVLVMESDSYPIKNISVYDILGQKVKVFNYSNRVTTAKLDIESLNEGMYILKMTTQEGLTVSKTFKKLK